MKQRTTWIWWSQGSPRDHIKVGIIHNKTKGVKEDIIRVQFLSSKPNHGIEFNMKEDEAIHLIAGLGKVLARLSWKEVK